MFIHKNILSAVPVAAGGTPTVIEVPSPPFGWLHRLVLRQASGAAATLTANLFEVPADNAQRAIHRVLPQQSSASPLYWQTDQGGEAFALLGTPLNPGKKLYLDVTHNGVAPITVDVCVVITTDGEQ